MALADMIVANRIEAARLKAENDRLQAEVADLTARCEAHEGARDKHHAWAMDQMDRLRAENFDLLRQIEDHEAAGGRCGAGGEPGEHDLWKSPEYLHGRYDEQAQTIARGQAREEAMMKLIRELFEGYPHA